MCALAVRTLSFAATKTNNKIIVREQYRSFLVIFNGQREAPEA
jgi:hypothetical protein